MNTPKTVAETLAEFAAALDGARAPKSARRAARRCLVDWWGGALAGSMAPPATLLATTLLPVSDPAGTGPARTLPRGQRTDARTAALVNGTAAHTMEVDDIYSPGLYHPGVSVIAAALAAGEAEGIPGERLLTAIVAGYEVSNRIARAINPAHYRYWHTTGTVGFLGAAVAAGSAMRLDAGRMAHAIATAATSAAGLRQAFASDAMSKPLHAGRAAEGGVLAALAARAGVTGVADILEAERGFGAAMSGEVDWKAALADLGDAWTIERMTVKPYPCCGHAFAAIDAMRALALEVASGSIERIEVHTYRVALEVCENPAPRTPYEAKFSLPYTVALAALGRPLDLAAFAPLALEDRDIRMMMSRVRLVPDDEAEAAFPALRGAEVRVVTRDGSIHRKRQRTRRGDPDVPLNDREIEEKFHALACPTIGAEAAREVAGALWRAETLESLREIPMPRPVAGTPAGG